MRRVVGIHSCEEVLKIRPEKIKLVTLKKDFDMSETLRGYNHYAKQNKIPIKLTSPQELDKICEGHQGVMFDVDQDPELDWNDLKSDKPCLLLALDGVEDPQNLGNIMRTAWLLGVTGIFITEHRSVGLTPTVCKIASGGAEHIAIESYNQIMQPLKQLKEIGFWVYGLSEKAEKPIWKAELHHKCVLVAGAEMKGLKTQTLNECDELVKVPQVDSAASLNVATSISMGMSEFCRLHGLARK